MSEEYEPYEVYPAEIGFLLGHITQLNSVRGGARKRRNPVGFSAPTGRKRKATQSVLPPWPDIPWMTR